MQHISAVTMEKCILVGSGIRKLFTEGIDYLKHKWKLLGKKPGRFSEKLYRNFLGIIITRILSV